MALFCTFHELLLKLALWMHCEAMPERGKSMNKFAFAFNFIVRLYFVYNIHSSVFFSVISSNIITPSLNVRRICSESFRHSACAYYYYHYALPKSGWVECALRTWFTARTKAFGRFRMKCVWMRKQRRASDEYHFWINVYHFNYVRLFCSFADFGYNGIKGLPFKQLEPP